MESLQETSVMIQLSRLEPSRRGRRRRRSPTRWEPTVHSSRDKVEGRAAVRRERELHGGAGDNTSPPAQTVVPVVLPEEARYSASAPADT